jgi:hypothetical protein
MPKHFKLDGYGTLDAVVARLAEEQPELVERIFKDWLSKERGIARMFPEQRGPGRFCEFVPRDFNGYVRHIAEMTQAEDVAVARWASLQDRYASSQFPPWQLPEPFGGRRFGETPLESEAIDETGDYQLNHPLRSPILSELSHWQRWSPPFGVPWRPYVEWPCPEEMSWEGDQRVASENGRYGRYAALPRRSDYNGHVPWQSRAYVKPWPFDDVWTVPQMDEIYLPREQIEEPEVVSQLLNRDLLDAIDGDDIPIPTEKVRFRIATMQQQRQS